MNLSNHLHHSDPQTRERLREATHLAGALALAVYMNRAGFEEIGLKLSGVTYSDWVSLSIALQEAVEATRDTPHIWLHFMAKAIDAAASIAMTIGATQTAYTDIDSISEALEGFVQQVQAQ